MRNVAITLLLAFCACARAKKAEFDDALAENLCIRLFIGVLKTSPNLRNARTDTYMTLGKPRIRSAFGVSGSMWGSHPWRSTPRVEAARRSLRATQGSMPLSWDANATLRRQLQHNERVVRNALPLLQRSSFNPGKMIACRAASLVPRELESEDRTARRYTDLDWLVALTTIGKSIVLRRIASHLVFNFIICAGVLYAQEQGFTTELSTLPHSLMGGFLGLLLVFRTNVAYARWWEARITWGGVNNDCRAIASAVAAYVLPVAPIAGRQFTDALADFPLSMARLCQSRPNSAQEPISDCGRMHKALNAAAVEGDVSFDNEIDPRRLSRMYAFQLTRISERVASLCEHAGACSRIANTPVPLSYSRHASRFLTLWCGTLPLILAPKLGYICLPVTLTTCWMLFGIEELGHLIEQPFETDAARYDISIPTDDIATDIQNAVRYHTNTSICGTASWADCGMNQGSYATMRN